MRTAPPLILDIPRQTGWRVAVGLLVLAAGVSLGAWLAQRDDAAMGAVLWAVTGAGLGGLFAGLGRVDATPCRLDWDGSAWSAADGAGTAGPPSRGRLRVALDLSVAMLLRFEPDEGAAACRGVCWIPVSARSLSPARWQALRRTVYSARPHAGGSPGGDGPLTE